MYKLNDLKEKLKITDQSIECPVKGCNVIVDRMYRTGNEGKNFECSIHKIKITPSTFIYNSDADNLLWNDNEDKTLLDNISIVKRECRMSSENSEDALSWNVFRYLEKNQLLSTFLNDISNDDHKIIDIIYWSYSENEKKLWSFLRNARLEFGESFDKGSEPDIMVLTDKTLFFIEAKYLSSNKTSGTGETLIKRIDNSKKYESGGNKHFDKIFKSDYKSLVRDQKYELMRFWILGTWIAKKNNLKFHLVNLVLENEELNIKQDFDNHIVTDSNNTFSRYTWEAIYSLILCNNSQDKDSLSILDYFKYKAASYDNKGLLKKAFNIDK